MTLIIRRLVSKKRTNGVVALGWFCFCKVLFDIFFIVYTEGTYFDDFKVVHDFNESNGCPKYRKVCNLMTELLFAEQSMKQRTNLMIWL